jgi:hypothetical protein
VVRDELRDAPDGGASSDWMGGMSVLSLRLKKDMLDNVVGRNRVLWRKESCDNQCIYYIT